MVQSAYKLQIEHCQHLDGEWKTLWSWKCPHGIQTFIWMAIHEQLLTNYRRSKWGVGISPLCNSCEETIIHMLSDYPNATHVWLKLILLNHISNLFSLICND
jgi:hypothetical protein